MADDDVTVTLTRDEALVLFELLHRWEDDDTVDGLIEPGEDVALWALSCTLETLLIEPFRPDYLELVAAARTRLRGEDESSGRASPP